MPGLFARISSRPREHDCECIATCVVSHREQKLGLSARRQDGIRNATRIHSRPLAQPYLPLSLTEVPRSEQGAALEPGPIPQLTSRSEHRRSLRQNWDRYVFEHPREAPLFPQSHFVAKRRAAQQAAAEAALAQPQDALGLVTNSPAAKGGTKGTEDSKSAVPSPAHSQGEDSGGRPLDLAQVRNMTSLLQRLDAPPQVIIPPDSSLPS
jgi:hypothetical protein